MRMEEPSHSNLPSLAPELSQKKVLPLGALEIKKIPYFLLPEKVFTDFVGTLLVLLADQA